MLIVGQLILDDASHIDIRSLYIPQAVLARAKARDLDLTGQQLGVVSVTAILEGIFDIVNNLVSQLQVL